MRASRKLAVALGVLAVGIVEPSGTPRAEERPRAAVAAPRPVTTADLARIENELREQRTTILQMLKLEQERSTVFLKMLESRCASGSPAGAEIDRGAASSAAPAEAAGGEGASGAAASGPRAGGGTAAVTGRVQGKGDLQNVYVFVEGMKSSGKGKAIEIVQKDKQFLPSAAVVVAGTTVSFPNRDAVFHNVFSPSPKPFDLGMKRSGEPVPSVTLDTPGVVEIDCNIHAKMTAKILVVPNRIFVKVRPDGTFALDKVPVGHRKLGAWGPDFKLQRREVDVTAAGAEVAFDLEREPPRVRLNKSGQLFGSYKE